jgi:hypothetical protein
LGDALQQFHHHRKIFQASGVHPDRFNLPRQHSLTHYIKLIWEYGSLNGLCLSITESKHIKAMKEPWQRSSQFQELPQILLTNQRLDKLAASHADFSKRGMLNGIGLTPVWRQIFRMFFQSFIELSELALHVIGRKVIRQS